MADVNQGPDWWQASDGKWYPPERHPDHREPSTQGVAAEPSTPPVHRESGTQVHSYNQLHTIKYRGGWIGLFAAENQTKALQRAIPELNASGLRVAAAVEDRWSVWKRIGVILLLIVTLGIVGRVPNILLITEPIG